MLQEGDYWTIGAMNVKIDTRLGRITHSLDHIYIFQPSAFQCSETQLKIIGSLREL